MVTPLTVIKRGMECGTSKAFKRKCMVQGKLCSPRIKHICPDFLTVCKTPLLRKTKLCNYPCPNIPVFYCTCAVEYVAS